MKRKKKIKRRKKKRKRDKGDPVLKVDRLTHIKITFAGTLDYRLIRIKSVKPAENGY